MPGLVEFLNEHTPLFAPFGKLAVVVALFALAWAVSRGAGRLAATVVDRAERRHATEEGWEDTGVIAGIRQRQTAIALVQTGIAYLVFALAVLLSIATLAGARRIETVVGASFLAILIAFAAQRFLTDVIAGLLMFFERWFRVGDTIIIEPWKLEGVVEDVSLRTTSVRGLNGELMRVPNSEVKAVRVIPRGYREYEVELFTTDEEPALALLEGVARLVPAGPSHFVRRPTVEETERLADDLVRVRLRAAVAPGREWLAEEFLPSVVAERADDDLLVHGPVAMPVDDHASSRFARSYSSRRSSTPARSRRRSRSRTESSTG